MSVTTPTLKFLADADVVALVVADALVVAAAAPPPVVVVLLLLLPHALANATVATNPTVSVPRRLIFALTTVSSQTGKREGIPTRPFVLKNFACPLVA
jgi:hypothetical protein